MILKRVLELTGSYGKMHTFLWRIRSEYNDLINPRLVESAFRRMEPLSLHRHEVFRSGTTYTIGKSIRIGSPIGSVLSNRDFFDAIHSSGAAFAEYVRPEIRREFKEIAGAVARMVPDVSLSIPIGRELSLLPTWDLSKPETIDAVEIRVESSSPETVVVKERSGRRQTFSLDSSILLMIVDEFEQEFLSLYERMLSDLKDSRAKNAAEERRIEAAVGRLVLVGLARDGPL